MTEIDWEQADRHQLIKILVAHVYPSAGAMYREGVFAALQKQSTETLRNMVKVTREQELERQEKRRQMRVERKAQQNEHTS